jgi:hypothetical protein
VVEESEGGQRATRLKVEMKTSWSFPSSGSSLFVLGLEEEGSGRAEGKRLSLGGGGVKFGRGKKESRSRERSEQIRGEGDRHVKTWGTQDGTDSGRQRERIGEREGP